MNIVEAEVYVLANIFFKCIYCNQRLITFNIVVVSAIPRHESPTGAHVSPVLNPLPPPSRPLPLGCPRGFDCPASYTELALAIGLKYGNIYTFQSYSLKPSHPRLLPQSPKVCSLHLCLVCCLDYRIVITVFLNSIYMR